jgi:signal transduction histidine kinase
MWRALLAIAIVQAFFWAVYYPFIVKRPPMPAVIAEAQDIREGPISAPTLAAALGANLQPITLPHEECCPIGYRALRFTLNLPTVPERGLVMLPALGGDNVFVYVNTHFADGRGRLQLPRPTYHRNDFRMIRIAPGGLRQGENDFVVLLMRSSSIGFDYAALKVFDAKDFTPAHEQREWIIGIFSWMQLAAAGLIALFALLLCLRSRARAAPFWLFMLAASWALHLLFFKWVDPPFDGNVRLGYSTSIFVLMAFACFGWAHSWSARRWRWMLGAAAIALVATFASVWGSVYLAPENMQFKRANQYAAIGALLLSVAAIIHLMWGAKGMDRSRIWELAFALPIPVGLAADMYLELTALRRLGITELSLPIFVTGLLVAFFSRNIHLFRSQEDLNNALRIELRDRTMQLEKAHAREQALVREQAHEAERQRILRDMHDGIGSQMMSLLLAARRGALSPAHMADGLQAIVDEMRLLIQSMDSVGESLTSALVLFKERVGAQVAQSGMSLHWSDAFQGPPPQYSPREVLHIFRILQEAATNAMKHAHASSLHVAIAAGKSHAYPVRIVVRDDGKGFAPQTANGRGLDNMAKRAAQIGAALDVRATDDGVAIVIDLPARPKE